MSERRAGTTPLHVEDGKIVIDRSQISDGYHTFAELYEHRHRLLILAMSALDLIDVAQDCPRRCWKALRHEDGTMYPGCFIAGINDYRIGQVSYHLPLEIWALVPGIELDHAPAWDGHTPADVVERLGRLGQLIRASVKPLRYKP